MRLSIVVNVVYDDGAEVVNALRDHPPGSCIAQSVGGLSNPLQLVQVLRAALYWNWKFHR